MYGSGASVEAPRSSIAILFFYMIDLTNICFLSFRVAAVEIATAL